MKRFFHHLVSFIAVAAIACSAVFSAVAAWRSELRNFGQKIGHAVKRVFLGGCELAAQGLEAVRRAVIFFVAARSYVQRIERRKDLQLTAGWRLVPSV